MESLIYLIPAALFGPYRSGWFHVVTTQQPV